MDAIRLALGLALLVTFHSSPRAAELELYTSSADAHLAGAQSALTGLIEHVFRASEDILRRVAEVDESAKKWNRDASVETRPGMRAIALQFADGARIHRANLVRIHSLLNDIGGIGAGLESDVKFMRQMQSVLKGFAARRPSAADLLSTREGIDLLRKGMDLRETALVKLRDDLRAQTSAVLARDRRFRALLAEMGNPQEPAKQWEREVVKTAISAIDTEKVRLEQVGLFGITLAQVLTKCRQALVDQFDAVVSLR